MGTYGLVRLAVPTVPDGFRTVAPFLAAAGAVGILWGGLACLVERDLKRLVAYSSVAHMGFVVLGLASGTQTGLQAALFGNIAHGIVSALLFFVVGGLKDRWGGADLTVARDALRDVSPRMGFALVVGFASALGLPGLVGFWGEFLAVYAAWNPADGVPTGLLRGCAVAGVVGMTLAAAYSLRVLRLVWAGHANWAGPTAADPGPRPDHGSARREDARGIEAVVLLALVVLVIGLGVLPRPLFGLTEPETATLVTRSAPAASPPPVPGGSVVQALERPAPVRPASEVRR
jgi:NADH-quinone oxidoreductase subunit M